jgi:hypothetical protein
MAVFLHVTQEKNIPNIKKNGIKGKKINNDIPCGVFCMPVTQNYYVSHQWVREMKRWSKGKNISGVYFRINNKEEVCCGHYNKEHVKISAGQAVKLAMNNQTGEGWEVILPRRVDVKDIIKYRHLPQTVGWRYFPGSHGKKLCLCPACIKEGTFKSVKMRLARYDALLSKLKATHDEEEIINILYEIDDMIIWSKGKIKDVKDINFLMNYSSEKIIKKLIATMYCYKTEESFASIVSFLDSENTEIKLLAAENILWFKKEKGFKYLKKFKDDKGISSLIENYRDILS